MNGGLRLGGLLVALAVVLLGERAAADVPAAAPADARPRLQTALAVIAAGGGAANFKTTTLLEVLAGPLAGTEATRITTRYGAPAVKGIVVTCDFVIAAVVRAGNTDAIVFPAAPAPDPTDGRALAGALYRAGIETASGRFGVERMLDRLVSRRLRIAILRDAAAKYGAPAVAQYLGAVRMLMSDLSNRYSL